jgi:hypothetical protein
MEEGWYLLSLSFRWPHEGIILGFEIWEPNEHEQFWSLKLHLLLVTINYDFGEDGTQRE